MLSSPISGRGPIVLLTVLLAGCGLSALLRPAGPGLAEMRSQSKLPAWLESWREVRAWPRRVSRWMGSGRESLIGGPGGVPSYLKLGAGAGSPPGTPLPDLWPWPDDFACSTAAPGTT